MLWFVPNVGYVDDADESANIPHYGELALPDGSKITWGDPGVREVPWLDLPSQYGSQYGSRFQWESGMGGEAPKGYTISPNYLNTLLQWSDLAETGGLQDFEREQYARMVGQAQGVPLRDVSTLYGGWTAAQEDPQGLRLLNVNSPDVGAFMLQTRDKIRQGTATPQEQALYQQTAEMAGDWAYRANVPQPSDVGIGFGDNLFGALAILGTGLGAGAALGPIAAGTATTLGTLGGLGTTAGIAGGWANTIGGATDQGWLANIGKALGIAGGLAGGIAGLGNTLSQGVTNLTQAANLAQQSGKVLGSLGQIPGAGPLQHPARYLGMAGQLGSMGGGVQNLLGAANTAQAAATGGRMADWGDWGNTDWLGWSGAEPYPMGSGGYGVLAGDAAPTIDWSSFTAGGPGSWAGQMTTDWLNGSGGAGGGGLLSTLGSLAGGVGKFLGSNSSWLGPAVSGLAGLGTGLLGSNASSDAAALQAAALNRGLDLSTAQWLAQQERSAPWVEAGRQALGTLQGLMGQSQPGFQGPATLNPADYRAGLPGAQPGWSPQAYAGYTPVEVPRAEWTRYAQGGLPRASDYRYMPGTVPDADQYRYTPGALPTLSGAELLANDPGVQFRLDEARRALEASAAARGGLTSGATLSALQRQSQDLASQEYGQAWNRAAQQAQMREQWGQQASTLGFGQAMSEAQLREQVHQIASQQGWSQAQAEAALREQLTLQRSAQDWQQLQQEAQMRMQQQQFGWQSGLQAQQQGQREQQEYAQELYQRMLGLNQLGYSRDLEANQTAYQRAMDAWNAQRLAQQTQFNQLSNVAGLGQTTIGQLGTQGAANAQQMANLYGQLGSAQGIGALGSAYNLNQGLGALGTGFTNLLKGLNA